MVSLFDWVVSTITTDKGPAIQSKPPQCHFTFIRSAALQRIWGITFYIYSQPTYITVKFTHACCGVHSGQMEEEASERVWREHQSSPSPPSALHSSLLGQIVAHLLMLARNVAGVNTMKLYIGPNLAQKSMDWVLVPSRSKSYSKYVVPRANLQWSWIAQRPKLNWKSIAK